MVRSRLPSHRHGQATSICAAGFRAGGRVGSRLPSHPYGVGLPLYALPELGGRVGVGVGLFVCIPRCLLTVLPRLSYYCGVMRTPGPCFGWFACLVGGGLMGGVVSYLLTYLPLSLLPSYLLLLSCLCLLCSVVPVVKGFVLLVKG